MARTLEGIDMIKASIPVAVLCALGVALSGCSSSAPKGDTATSSSAQASTTTQAAGDSSPATPADLTPVTIQFTYTWAGYYGALVYADELGLFAKEGLKVSFKEGKGSQTVFASLGEGMNTFVITPMSNSAQATSSGVPVISVATFQPVNPSVLVAKAGTELKTPKDLEGKKVGLRSGANAALFFDAFLKQNGVDASKVHLTKLDSSAATTAFLTGSTQVVDAFANNELPTIAAQLDKPPVTLAFADFGFSLLGDGVAVSTAFLKSSPDVVKRFLRAEIAGIEAAKANPEAAAKAIKDRVGVALPDLSIVEEQMKATLEADEATAGHPLGWVSDVSWSKMLGLFESTGQIKNRLDMSAYFTNDYLPGS